MSLTTVQDTVLDPSSNPVAGALVRVTLITASDQQPGYTSGGTVVVPETTITSASGGWSLGLNPNVQITPANTYYQITVGGKISNIVVPATGGPYAVSAILATPPPVPSAPGITAVQVALAGTVVGSRPQINLIQGAGSTLTVADNVANARVDVTIASAAGGGGVPTSRQILAGAGLTGGGDLTVDRTLAANVGTGVGSIAAGDDTRITGAVQGTRQVIAGTGLTGGGTLAADRTLAVAYGATVGTSAQGNDTRLADARTPTVHATTHQPGGADAMAVDAAAGVGSLRTLGAGAAQAAAGNDTRLSNARTPTAHAASHQPGAADPLTGLTSASFAAANVDGVAATASLRTLGAGAQQATSGTDARLSDARTPTTHAATHASAGADPVTVAESQVTGLVADLAAKAPTTRIIAAGVGLTGGGDLAADRTFAVAYGVTSTTAARGDLAAPKADPTFTGTATLVRSVNAPVALADAVTIVTDAALGNYFRVTLTANRTLGAPTNPVDGQKAIWEVTQDATGSRTLTLATGVGGFAFGTDITAVTLSTAVNATDLLGAVYHATRNRWLVIAFVRGF